MRWDGAQHTQCHAHRHRMTNTYSGRLGGLSHTSIIQGRQEPLQPTIARHWGFVCKHTHLTAHQLPAQPTPTHPTAPITPAPAAVSVRAHSPPPPCAASSGAQHLTALWQGPPVSQSACCSAVLLSKEGLKNIKQLNKTQTHQDECRRACCCVWSLSGRCPPLPHPPCPCLCTPLHCPFIAARSLSTV